MGFREKLLARQQENKSCVCVGIDPNPSEMPGVTTPAQLLEWGISIFERARQFAALMKPQSGFFEGYFSPRNFPNGTEYGMSDGIRVMEQLCWHIAASGFPLDLDWKRGDVGKTAAAYASAALGLKLDACTVNCYLGSDSVFEFLKAGLFTFVLCKTSNLSSVELQDRKFEGGDIVYLDVARLVKSWDEKFPGQLGIVCGATFPAELRNIMAVAPNLPKLIPGIGKQSKEQKKEDALKGTIDAVLSQGAKKASESIFVINSSSEIDFAPDPAAATKALRDQINALLPAGFYD